MKIASCVDTFGEYGLDAARAAVDVQVVGAAEVAEACPVCVVAAES
jgi:hypothetical protein